MVASGRQPTTKRHPRRASCSARDHPAVRACLHTAAWRGPWRASGSVGDHGAVRACLHTSAWPRPWSRPEPRAHVARPAAGTVWTSHPGRTVAAALGACVLPVAVGALLPANASALGAPRPRADDDVIRAQLPPAASRAAASLTERKPRGASAPGGVPRRDPPCGRLKPVARQL